LDVLKTGVLLIALFTGLGFLTGASSYIRAVAG